jgi:hypothetical protein
VVRDPQAEGMLSEAATRLQAELAAAGFEVVFVDGTPDIDPTAQVAAALGASPPFATVAVVRSEAGVVADIWVADRASGKSIVRRIDVSAADLGAPRVLAIRAVELLRASLLDLPEASAQPAAAPFLTRIPVTLGASSGAPPDPGPSLPPSPPRSPAAAQPWPVPAPSASAWPPSTPALHGAWANPPSVRAPRKVERAEDRPRALFEGLTLQASLAALVTFGGFGESLAPSLAAGYGWRRGWVARLALVGPKARVDLEGTAAGSASVRDELAMAELAYAFGSPEAIVVPTASLGAGVYHASIEGTAQPPYIAYDEDSWAAVAEAGVGLAARAGSRFAFVVDARMLILLPEPVVLVAGEEVGRAGTPAWLASFGLLLKL